MEKLIKLPGFKSFDRNFDRLPERMRWMVEKVVHDPDAPEAPKPTLPPEIETHLLGLFGEDSRAIQEFAGREFPRWKTPARPTLRVRACRAGAGILSPGP